jgi:hypothetical protein
MIIRIPSLFVAWTHGIPFLEETYATMTGPAEAEICSAASVVATIVLALLDASFAPKRSNPIYPRLLETWLPDLRKSSVPIMLKGMNCTLLAPLVYIE